MAETGNGSDREINIINMQKSGCLKVSGFFALIISFLFHFHQFHDDFHHLSHLVY